MNNKFKLDTVLRFRHHEEERRQKEFAEAQRALEEEQAVLSAHLDVQRKTELDFQNCQNNSPTGPQAAMYRQFLQRLSALIAEQQAKVRDAEIACEKTRSTLLEAMKKRKALERLKEKALQTYLENLNKEENKFIEEMAINRFTLNQQ